MAYVPNPADPTQPTDAIAAETAQAEFRALKAYIQSLIPGGFSASSYNTRNKFINPRTDIDQANAGGNVAVATTTRQFSSDGYSVSYTGSGAGISAQQIADGPPNGGNNCIQISVTTGAALAAGDFLILSHRIEGIDCVDLNFGAASAAAVSFQFAAKFSLAGTYGIALRNSALNRTWLGSFTILPAQVGVWTTVQIPNIPGDVAGVWLQSQGSVGIEVIIALAAGATFQGVAGWQAGNFFTPGALTNGAGTNGAIFKFTDFQFELGAVNTPVQILPFAWEVVRAQRQYEKSYNAAIAPGTANANGPVEAEITGLGSFVNSLITPISFAVKKCNTPSMLTYSAVTGAAGKVRDIVNGADVAGTWATINDRGASLSASTNAAATTAAFTFFFTADARL